MDAQVKKKKARLENEDRISKLPDDLIHQIMLFMDTRFAVQTSVLSKRWKFVWTTLPFLDFNVYIYYYSDRSLYSKFVSHVFSHRNHQSLILKLDINSFKHLDLRLMKKYVRYAISHGVQRLHVRSNRYCLLSTFSSDSLKELRLEMKFVCHQVMESCCWTLPNLTTLYLSDDNCYTKHKFPESCLICLPALTTLGFTRCKLPEFLSLPALKTLCLECCYLPEQVWHFPDLSTLQLTDVVFPKNVSEYFLALTSLRNLYIDFAREDIRSCVISSSQLVNLEIRAPLNNANAYEGKFVVLAPKLCNFNAIGFFRITFEGSGLENVNIKFWDCTIYKKKAPSWVLKEHQDLFKIMFSQLGSTKILTLDLVTLKALSEIADVLLHLRCPFYKLKYLKLPHGCEESSISSTVSQYLLSGSPIATIVKSLSPDDLIPQMVPRVSLLAQNLVLEEPSATPTKALIDSQYTHSQYTHENTYGDIVDMRLPEENMVDNFVGDSGKVRKIEAPVAGAINDRTSISWNNRHLVLWRDHEVSSEFVGLLDAISKRYPETFEQLPTKNKKISTMKLNMLCASVNAFTETTLTEVDAELLAEYRALFTDLQRWGFNINWLMSRLNYLEKLQFSKPSYKELHENETGINNARLTDSESRQTMGTGLAPTACFIGDGVL